MANATITDPVESLRQALVAGDMDRARTLIGNVWNERDYLRKRIETMRDTARTIVGDDAYESGQS